jgi:hypothetical protein
MSDGKQSYFISEDDDGVLSIAGTAPTPAKPCCPAP